MRAWIRALLCIMIAVVLVHLLVTGEIVLFVNPKFQWLIWVSVALLLFLAMVQLSTRKESELHPVKLWGYLFFLLPIAIYLFLPDKQLDASMAEEKGVQQIKESSKPVIVDQVGDPYEDIAKELQSKDIIRFDDENYGNYINTIQLYGKQLVGKKIQIRGFVYRDEKYPQNEFIIARYTVTCCVADATVIGFLVQSKSNQALPNNQWIEMTGIIQMEKVDDYEMPMIQLDSYQPIQPLKDPYIYF